MPVVHAVLIRRSKTSPPPAIRPKNKELQDEPLRTTQYTTLKMPDATHDTCLKRLHTVSTSPFTEWAGQRFRLLQHEHSPYRPSHTAYGAAQLQKIQPIRITRL